MKYILLLMIKCYRKCISPLFPPCCRYYPTCSKYAVTAIERFGMGKGLALAIFRILRCHPWAKGGIDEVPVSCTWKQVIYPASSQQKHK
ncbi:MAG: membrane protein insertion efficiency factor YidD [Oscillospiraceae bacterium]|nr:membrane protein insertion efficiency factor YidD [Oscillospiraceae bacterium]